jgi:cytochrome c
MMPRPAQPALILLLGLAACEGRGGPPVAPTPPPGAAGSTVPAAVAAYQPVPEGPFGLGRAPTAAEVKAWNISVNPEGRNLPPGRGTYAEGKRLYAEQCAVCHGQNGEGVPPLYPQLIGREPSDFSFDDDFRKVHTIGNYWPYATTLYDYVNRAMPLTAPGSLQPAQIYSLVAYMLAANGVIAEDMVIDAKSLPRVRMPARDRFVPDDRTGGATFR